MLERANDEMLVAAVLEQIHSEDIGMRRAILHALGGGEIVFRRLCIDRSEAGPTDNALFLSTELVTL